jgi:hypothetical protein
MIPHKAMIVGLRKRGGLREITKLPIRDPQPLPPYVFPHLG